MKFVALISGGKDSIYSLMECLRNGHEIVACAHLQPHDSSDEESYMYQTAGSECIKFQVEECLGLPLLTRQIEGRTQVKALIYDTQINADNGDKSETVPTDEVEDLYLLLHRVKTLYPSITAVSSGAILSTYQRSRIESVCLRLNLTSLAYLWRIGSQRRLLQYMVDDGLEAVLVKVASPPGLQPRRHLNKSVKELLDLGLFDHLYERFNFHVCGEGGEYETLTLDCPLFRKRLVLTETEIVESADGVGILKINRCSTVDKEFYVKYDQFGLRLDNTLVERMNPSLDNDTECNETVTDNTSGQELLSYEESEKILSLIPNRLLPNVKYLSGGLASISEILSPVLQRDKLLGDNKDIDMSAARFETACILDILSQTLSSLDWLGNIDETEKTSVLDVIFVHLYLTSMSYFQIVNQLYKNLFGSILPPSRSCIAINNLPGGRRVMLTCLVQRGSGDYMRWDPYQQNKMSPFVQNEITSTNCTQLRSTLHVQSVSHWAPVCIGPYSQANTLRSGLIFFSGQIGLVPSSMTLSSSDLDGQLKQAWRNAAAVSEAVNSSLKNSFGALIFIDSKIIKQKSPSQTNSLWKNVQSISRQMISSNRTTTSASGEFSFEGYEDEETWKEIQKLRKNSCESHADLDQDQSQHAPLMMVAVSALPLGALTEIEIVCATNSCASILGISSLYKKRDFVDKSERIDEVWNLGYEGSWTSRETKRTSATEKISIHAALRSCGWSCISYVFLSASISSHASPFSSSFLPAFYIEQLLFGMITNGLKVMETSGLGLNHILHVRMFYVGIDGDDGLFIRLSLQSSLSRIWPNHPCRPTFSIIPVDLIRLTSDDDEYTFLAMQINSMDLLHLNTDLWIHGQGAQKNV